MSVAMSGSPHATPEERAALDVCVWTSLTFVSGSSDKFWRCRWAGRVVEFWWGRRGAAGEKLVKRFTTNSGAALHAAFKIQEKQNKGYQLGGAVSGAALGQRAAAAVSGRPGAGAPSLPKVLRRATDGGSAVALGRFSALGRPSALDEDEDGDL